MGNRALYKDGWYAVTFHGHFPWKPFSATGNFDDDHWELYNIREDFSMTNDLASVFPGKLEELKCIWRKEAAINQVFPLDDRLADRISPALNVQRKQYIFYGSDRSLPSRVAPHLNNSSYSIDVFLETYKQNENGLILSAGGNPAGFALYMRNGKLFYTYNFLQKRIYSIKSDRPMVVGNHHLRIEFMLNSGSGSEAEVKLLADGRVAGTIRIGKIVPFSFCADESFDIGSEYGSPVSEDYAKELPFVFEGKIDKVKVNIK